MTSFEHLDELLSALVDGELSPSEEAEARAHLAGCSTCTEELAAVEAMRSLVRALPALDLPPLVVERVRWLDRRRVPPRVAAVAAGAVAVAASLLFTVVAPQGQSVTPPVGRLVEVHATSGVNGDPVSQLVPAAVPVSFRE